MEDEFDEKLSDLSGFFADEEEDVDDDGKSIEELFNEFIESVKNLPQKDKDQIAKNLKDAENEDKE